MKNVCLDHISAVNTHPGADFWLPYIFSYMQNIHLYLAVFTLILIFEGRGTYITS